MWREPLRPRLWRQPERDQPSPLCEPSAHRAHRGNDRRSISIAPAKLVDHDRRGLARCKPLLRLAPQLRPGVRSGFVSSVDRQSQALDVRCQSRASPMTESALRSPDPDEPLYELAAAVAQHERGTAVRRAQPQVNAVREKPQFTRAASPVPADRARRPRAHDRNRSIVRGAHPGRLAHALRVLPLPSARPTGPATAMAPFASP